jgi:hypothetical protein
VIHGGPKIGRRITDDGIEKLGDGTPAEWLPGVPGRQDLNVQPLVPEGKDVAWVLY